MYAEVQSCAPAVNHDQGTYSQLNREVMNSTAPAQSNTTAPVYSSLAPTNTSENEYDVPPNYSVITQDQSSDTVEPADYPVPAHSVVHLQRQQE